MTGDQISRYNEELLSDIDEFKKITIDKETGNIIYNDDKEDIIINSRYTAVTNENLDIMGYDGSCFDICHDSTSGKTLGLCKVFVRKTNQDIENGPGYSQDWYSCMGLFTRVDAGVTTHDVLFSRVVFPRYYKTSTNSIMFNYYIYF